MPVRELINLPVDAAVIWDHFAFTTGKVLTLPVNITLAGVDNKALTLNKNITLDGTDGRTLTLNGNLLIGGDTTIGGGGNLNLNGFVVNVASSGTLLMATTSVFTTAPLQGGGSIAADLTLSIDPATTVAAGSMSAADKIKVNQFVLGANKTFTLNNTFTLSGTDGKTLTLTGALSIAADTTITGGGTLALGGFTFTVSASGTAVLTSRIFTAGAGLTGLGDFSADRTVDVGAGNGITVNANDVAVNQGYAFAWTAQHSFSPGSAVPPFTLGANAQGQKVTYFNADQLDGLDMVTTGPPSAHIPGADASGNFRMTSLGINCIKDAQFSLDIGGNLRAQGWIVGKHAIQVSGALMICHYDGIPPYPTDYTGTTMGHMGQIGTVAGGVIFRPGKFGKGVQIGEATTNLFPNPHGETNLTGLTTGGTNTMTRDTTLPLYGTNSIKVVYGNSTVGVYSATGVSFTSGQAYTMSYYARKVDGSAVTTADTTVNMFMNNLPIAIATIYAVDNGWYRVVSVPYTAAATTALSTGIYIAAGATLWYSGIQVENKAYATPYCDGSLGTGHSWSGTAHNSSSSRTAASVTYDTANNILPARGTISVWVNEWSNPAALSGGPLAFLYNAGGTSTSFVYLYRNMDTGVLLFAVANSSTAYPVSTTGIDWTVPHMFVGVWNTNRVELYVDGISVGTPVTSATMPTTFGSSFKVGIQSNAAQRYANAIIDDLVILNRAATADEIRAWYESDAPLFAETSVWGWTIPTQKVWADANGLWAVDDTGLAVLGVSSVNSQPWGGLTLDKGDVLIGRDPSYSLWDNSAAIQYIKGNITATTGNIGGWVIGATTLADTTGAVTLDSTNKWLSVSNGGTEYSRVGLLTGIADTAFPGGISGYGIYIANAFVKGNLVATGGTINGVLTVNTSPAGEFRTGSGVMGSTFTGIRQWFSGGFPKMTAYNAGVQAWEINAYYDYMYLTGDVAVYQPTHTSSVQAAFQVQGGPHTTLPAGVGYTDVYMALNRTVQHATGAITNQLAMIVAAPTYSFVGASTITNAATLYIDAAPGAGTNATITNPYAAWIGSGATRLGGAVLLDANMTFQGAGQRLKGDFTNATRSNRLLFQTSTASSATNVGFIPSANTNITQVSFFDQTDPDNSHQGFFQITPSSTVITIGSAITGTATTNWPIRFTIGGTEVLRVDASGLKIVGEFGCNGASEQAAVASGGAAPAGGTGATAGAYDTAAHRDALITLVNNIRTALVNNGIMS